DGAQPLHRRRRELTPRVDGPELVHALAQRVAQITPGLVEAREVQLLLRRKVPVEDRLRDAGLARDLRRRRTRVAVLGEDAQGSAHDGAPALARRETRGMPFTAARRHAAFGRRLHAPSGTAAGSAWRTA